MKITQKLFAILMTAGMLLSFAACNSTPKEPLPNVSSEIVLEKPLTTGTIANLSFTYAADLETEGSDSLIKVNYSEDSFFMTIPLAVNLKDEEKFNDVVAEGLTQELSEMFNQGQWKNNKMITDIRRETVGDIEIWSSEFECEIVNADGKFNTNITLAVYDEEVVVFTLVSKAVSYPEVSRQFADTIKSLQPAA